MLQLLLVGIGGFLGSMLRFWMGGVAQRYGTVDFPLGTCVVNLLGCLAVGFFWSLVEYRDWFSPDQRIFVTAGILGGYTTFSAFGYETFMLLRDGEYQWALLNVTVNVLLGIAAVFIGWLAARVFE